MTHLSSEQISRLIAGAATPQEQQHAGECVQCRAELAQARKTFSDFRDSVREWSERNRRSAIPYGAFQDTTFPTQSHLLRWVVFAAALVLLMAIPFYNNAVRHEREAEALEDTLLLEQVNMHLSRSVAAPMEPFMEILSGDSAAQTGGRQ